MTSITTNYASGKPLISVTSTRGQIPEESLINLAFPFMDRQSRHSFLIQDILLLKAQLVRIANRKGGPFDTIYTNEDNDVALSRMDDELRFEHRRSLLNGGKWSQFETEISMFPLSVAASLVDQIDREVTFIS